MKTRCDISKCKAACCHNVPHTMYTLNTNKKRIVTQPLYLSDNGLKDDEGRKLYTPIVDKDFRKNKCPFLRDDYKCNIYEQRPRICRIFGSPKEGTHKFLHCGWLEGRECDNPVENELEANEYFAEMVNLLIKGQLK